MNTQPESLRLSEKLDKWDFRDWDKELIATELRRLRTENEALKAQRDELLEATEKIASFKLEQFFGPHGMALECVNAARAAIASVKDAT